MVLFLEERETKHRPKGESSRPYLSVPLSPGVENICIFSKVTTGKLLDR